MPDAEPTESAAPSKQRAMLLTVGLPLGDDRSILASLEEDIRLVHPRKIVMIATASSRDHARTIAEKLRFAPECVTIKVLQGAHDLRDAFITANQAIRDLIEAGFDPGCISINYTSGTKVMSTGLVMAATLNSCESLRYIMRDRSGGQSNSFITSPRTIITYRDMLRAGQLFEHLQFASAQDLLDELDDDQLDERDALMLRDQRLLSSFYFNWENFRYREALALLARLNGCCRAIKIYYPDPTMVDQLERIAQSVAGNSLDPLLLVDIYNNALRKKIEGKYDDAITRCYRVLEMLAQSILLCQFEVDTDDLNTRKVPAKFRANFEALRSADDGIVRIGLRKAYELLKLLEHPLGEIFWNHPDTSRMLDLRGKSSLAHGVRPVDKELCARFLQWTQVVLESQIESFAQLSNSLQFIWLRDKMKTADEAQKASGNPALAERKK